MILQVIKTAYQASVAVVIAMTALPALAESEGGAHGGGGGAFICPNKNDSEILDLFEARLAGIKIKTSTAPVALQIEKALARFNPQSNLYKRMIETLARVQSAKKIPLPSGFDLAWPSDAKNKYAKTGCEAKSVILFNDQENSMDFDAQAFLQLSDTQQAALIVHETVYKFLRETVDERDSIRTRKIVGHLFSQETQAEFNKAVGEIADFYPMAIPRLAFKSAQNFGPKIIYPASYEGEPMRIMVDVTLDASADKACTLDNTQSPRDWAFGTSTAGEPGFYAKRHCIGKSDGSNLTIPACVHTIENSVSSGSEQAIGGWVRVVKFEGPLGQKTKRLECPARVRISDPYGSSLTVLAQSVYGSVEHEMQWQVITFPSKQK